VLKYSQSDVDRLRKQFELDAQARILAKEHEWLLKYEQKDKDKKQLEEQVVKLEKSHNAAKWVYSRMSCSWLVSTEQGM